MLLLPPLLLAATRRIMREWCASGICVHACMCCVVLCMYVMYAQAYDRDRTRDVVCVCVFFFLLFFRLIDWLIVVFSQHCRCSQCVHQMRYVCFARESAHASIRQMRVVRAARVVKVFVLFFFGLVFGRARAGVVRRSCVLLEIAELMLGAV